MRNRCYPATRQGKWQDARFLRFHREFASFKTRAAPAPAATRSRHLHLPAQRPGQSPRHHHENQCPNSPTRWRPFVIVGRNLAITAVTVHNNDLPHHGPNWPGILCLLYSCCGPPVTLSQQFGSRQGPAAAHAKTRRSSRQDPAAAAGGSAQAAAQIGPRHSAHRPKKARPCPRGPASPPFEPGPTQRAGYAILCACVPSGCFLPSRADLPSLARLPLVSRGVFIAGAKSPPTGLPDRTDPMARKR